MSNAAQKQWESHVAQCNHEGLDPHVGFESGDINGNAWITPVRTVALLNTTICTTDGSYRVKTISLDEAKRLVEGVIIDSAIGHQATAEAMTELLGIPVAVNRQQFQQEVGQQAVVFKLKGRVPEGVILTREQLDEIGYEFKLMVREA